MNATFSNFNFGFGTDKNHSCESWLTVAKRTGIEQEGSTCTQHWRSCRKSLDLVVPI